MVRYKDLTGEIIGKWVVVSKYLGEKKGTTNHIYWICVCVCGAKSVINGSDLRRGRSLQCSLCADKERNLQHGDSRKDSKYRKLYKQWNAMKSRCNGNDPSNVKYYKEKGITYFSGWEKYEEFKSWALANGWSPELTLDRINGNKDYSPDNCRWATRVQQQRNRSCSIIITINGISTHLRDAIDYYGNVVKAPAVLRRLENGWDPLKAVSTPKIIGRPKKKE